MPGGPMIDRPASVRKYLSGFGLAAVGVAAASLAGVPCWTWAVTALGLTWPLILLAGTWPLLRHRRLPPWAAVRTPVAGAALGLLLVWLLPELPYGEWMSERLR